MSVPASLSTERIVTLVGRLDDAILAEIHRLNPSEDELVEALAWLDGDVADEPIPHPSRARTMALFAVLADAFDDEDATDDVTEPH
jgi:hypothetical protein